MVSKGTEPGRVAMEDLYFQFLGITDIKPSQVYGINMH